MEGKANIAIGQVNVDEKQKLALTYVVAPIDSIEEAQKIKYAMDAVAVMFGADVHREARILGKKEDENARKVAKDTAEAAVEE